ncbi:lactococcin 972 family bacteriocin [Bifidobacterium sp. MA2]|uniref:Lactococcin 972 family bacteriocin n=1 Tax=Bifidobacterium santillanense TaxID=2809028 RepID=A0ABS5UPF1_9BIFI|nr:lactococcin 972 family bacteriocin [Bifidobacterium santillanense]MBT1172756.1 lactococcin 972 family bacteriocin [Bifidobacterium santillanense]
MSKKTVSFMLAALLAITSSVGAVTAQAEDYGDDVDSGMVANVPEGKFTVDDTNPILRTTRIVGGGTWVYGSYITRGEKVCYSHYKNNKVYHWASVSIGGKSATGTAPAGQWAYISETGPIFSTCDAFWGKNN